MKFTNIEKTKMIYNNNIKSNRSNVDVGIAKVSNPKDIMKMEKEFLSVTGGKKVYEGKK